MSATQTGNGHSADLREEFILASALIHTFPPTKQWNACTYRVLENAMIAAGAWTEEMAVCRSEIFHGRTEDFPTFDLWYLTLISLTQREPRSERLLEGGGNLETPAGAYFTACALTPAGMRVAVQLLAAHPEWIPSLTRLIAFP